LFGRGTERIDPAGCWAYNGTTAWPWELAVISHEFEVLELAAIKVRSRSGWERNSSIRRRKYLIQIEIEIGIEIEGEYRWGELENPNNSVGLRWASQAQPNLRG